MTLGPEAEIVIGTITAPFGLGGEVKVRPETDYPERFLDLDEVSLRAPDGHYECLRVESVRFHKKAALVKFGGYGDIDAVEKLRGWELVVPESQTVDLPEHEYFIHDLIGLHVYGVDGRDLGEITEVIRGPANDAYVTGTTIVPALKSVVRDVDIAGRRMVVDLPEE